jgi:hypothetical protein
MIYYKNMPELNRFLGIIVLMYFDDHNLRVWALSWNGLEYIKMNCWKIEILYWKMVWVVKAKLKDTYKVFIEFRDGTSGVIDFKEKLSNDHRQIVKDLLDEDTFKSVRVDLDTLCWDNGVDFSPEYLYENVIKKIV